MGNIPPDLPRSSVLALCVTYDRLFPACNKNETLKGNQQTLGSDCPGEKPKGT